MSEALKGDESALISEIQDCETEINFPFGYISNLNHHH